ncbi:MAG: TonB family protein [Maricaulaceae bacterium]|jgi:TonB family protein
MSSLSPLPRYALSLPIAALFAVSLGALMQALVAQKEVVLPPPPERTVPEIVSKREITEVEIGTRFPDPVERTAPDRPVIERPVPGDKPGTDVNFAPEPPGPGGLEPTPTSGARISGPQRIFDPVTEYPSSMNGREGSCRVRFTVATSGSVVDPEIVSCTHNGFARAALTAASRAGYLPAQGERGPVVTEGVMLTIVFQMPQD